MRLCISRQAQRKLSVYCCGLFFAQYLADIFAREGCLDKLRGFACEHAAAFFGIPKKGRRSVEQTKAFEQMHLNFALFVEAWLARFLLGAA